MKVVKFLVDIGFQRRSKSSSFYDFTYNSVNYCFQKSKGGGVMMKNCSVGGAVSIERVKSSFDENHLVLLMSMHDVLDEIKEHIETRIRLKTIDNILADLEDEPT